MSTPCSPQPDVEKGKIYCYIMDEYQSPFTYKTSTTDAGKKDKIIHTYTLLYVGG